MKKLLIALRELKQVLIQVAFSEALIDSLIVLLISFIVCIFLNMPILWGFVPGVLFFVFLTSRKFKNVKLEDVEKKYPDLKEQLRAAADNLYKENDIVHALHHDVLLILKKVKSSSFLRFKRMWREIVIIAALCFLVILLTSLNMRFLDYKEIARDIQEFNQKRSPDIFDAEFVAGFGNESDIWGNESLAQLGLENLDLQINPIFSEINLNDIQDAEEQDFEEGAFPSDIEAKISSQEGDDNIPKEHKEIVKKYFTGLASEQ